MTNPIRSVPITEPQKAEPAASPERVIFLDIDGVLNDHKKLPGSVYCGIDADKVARLNRLLSLSGASVVLISAWRYMLNSAMTLKGFEYLLNTHGVYQDREWLYGQCCTDDKIAERDCQIRDWLNGHQGVKQWVIIDDDPMGMAATNLNQWLVKTDGAVGFTDNDVLKALAILGVAEPAKPRDESQSRLCTSCGHAAAVHSHYSATDMGSCECCDCDGFDAPLAAQDKSKTPAFDILYECAARADNPQILRAALVELARLFGWRPKPGMEYAPPTWPFETAASEPQSSQQAAEQSAKVARKLLDAAYDKATERTGMTKDEYLDRAAQKSGPAPNPPAEPMCNCGRPDTCYAKDCPECAPRNKVIAEPGREPGWLIWYEDVEREPEVFAGENSEPAARARFNETSVNWNATLFREVESNCEIMPAPGTRLAWLLERQGNRSAPVWYVGNGPQGAGLRQSCGDPWTAVAGDAMQFNSQAEAEAFKRRMGRHEGLQESIAIEHGFMFREIPPAPASEEKLIHGAWYQASLDLLSVQGEEIESLKQQVAALTGEHSQLLADHQHREGFLKSAEQQRDEAQPPPSGVRVFRSRSGNEMRWVSSLGVLASYGIVGTSPEYFDSDAGKQHWHEIWTDQLRSINERLANEAKLAARVVELEKEVVPLRRMRDKALEIDRAHGNPKYPTSTFSGEILAAAAPDPSKEPT